MVTTQPLIEMQGITKFFNGVKAVHNISLKLQSGTVHALMGENGAGKSTTMKILTGIYKPDRGIILVDGNEVHFASPKAALDHGISMIHQELSPVLEMSIAENVFLGREPMFPGTPFINYNKMYRETKKLFEDLGLDINPKRKMKHLSISETQMVEIVKAVSYNSRVIIMDEPTSSLADKEVEQLFKIIRKLKSDGKGIIYISHKMEEIFQISDDITVFRDGEYISTSEAKNLTQGLLIKQMVGRELTEVFPNRKKAITNEVVLEVNDLSAKGLFRGISFQLNKGEILGLTGLMGAGRTEFVKALFGLLPFDSGSIKLNNKTIRIKEPRDAIQHGIALVTEDRKGEGLVLPMSVKANMTLPTLKKVSSGFFVRRNAENQTVDEMITALRIKTHNKNQLVETLSGGNQQKIVLAKWLLTNPRILILDEPTRGIDIGAKTEIYKLMDRLTQEGYSIIMISSEMPEVLGMSDRIAVLCEGRITGILGAEEATQEKILSLATPDKMEETT
ncbi:inositol transport system ATP-binding protein [Paenibacillus tianmuensis]|uniref:Ribose/galactose/methyl galactoside import ATP-binding protein n=1 Tax=Paenibacillus tianmuensis TaxID=624147 RepID=A0A1G4QG39_9BACL|nr:sugar ABC transporter ATP-binding protein [Paenibacillus tianmuensis]SCW43613.1 inositol transport system ATP-binding protein [Paenibacillus tianmuensis]